MPRFYATYTQKCVVDLVVTADSANEAYDKISAWIGENSEAVSYALDNADVNESLSMPTTARNFEPDFDCDETGD